MSEPLIEKSSKTFSKPPNSSNEQSSAVENQASAMDISTSRKPLVQQVLHPGLFLQRPRSASIGSCPTQSSTDDKRPYEAPQTPTDSPQPPPWQKVPCNRNKKRKLSTSPPVDSTETSNRYDALPVDVEEMDKPINKTKPPPVILYGIEDLNELTKLLETTINKELFTYKVVNKTNLRINTADIDVYKKLTTLVREKGLIGHTFNRKDKRCFRIVIKNLHPTTPVNIIQEEIEATGNTVTGEIINARFGPNKNPTSTFFVNLLSGPQNKAIKELKYIYHQSITIEEPKKKKTIVQCQRCQQYGHTKNYCMRPYRCVKCGESHKTSTCEKRDRSSPAKCALCGGPHTANHKGCEVYKEILARRQKRNTSSTVNKAVYITPVNNKHNATIQPNHSEQSLSYAETAKLNRTVVPNQIPRNTFENTHSSGQLNVTLEQIIIKQTEKFDIILQQMSTLMSLIAKLVDKLTK